MTRNLDIDAVPLEELPAVIAELAALQARAAMRLQRAPKIEPETFLTAAEVADVLRMSEDWVAHAKLPFRRKVGGAVRYSAAGLARWQRAQGNSR
jgi:hypothetical protein